jgi:pre-mRNA-splicing factor CWC26
MTVAQQEQEQNDADAILRDVAEERRAQVDEGDEAPAIVGDISEDDAETSMMPAGLQLPTLIKSTKKKSKKRSESPSGAAPTTIYRDASGRIINVAMARREAARKAEEEERKKKEEEKAARGDVQNQMREEAKQKLADAKYIAVARTKDDEEMNDELKEVRRWNDPAAGFLTTVEEEDKSRGKGKEGKKVGKPTYRGAFDPNRYGIRPGSRWDGVDRSTGFEKKWFSARNKKKDRSDLEYAWQMDE